MLQSIRNGLLSANRPQRPTHLLAMLMLCLTIGVVVTLATAHHNPGHGGGGGGPGGGSGGGGGGGSLDPFPIATCGTAVAGVECWLFETDSGAQYILDTTNPNLVVIGPDGEPMEVDQPYEHGERIYVEGFVDPFCFSFCMQGSGCLVNFTVSDCPDDGNAISGPTTYNTEDMLHLIANWGLCGEYSACRWDLNDTGRVDTNDLTALLSKFMH